LRKVDTSGKPAKLSLSEIDQRELFGPDNNYVREIELEFPVKIIARGDELQIYGNPEDIEKVKEIFEQMIRHVQGGGILTEQALAYAIKIV